MERATLRLEDLKQQINDHYNTSDIIEDIEPLIQDIVSGKLEV